MRNNKKHTHTHSVERGRAGEWERRHTPNDIDNRRWGHTHSIGNNSYNNGQIHDWLTKYVCLIFDIWNSYHSMHNSSFCPHIYVPLSLFDVFRMKWWWYDADWRWEREREQERKRKSEIETAKLHRPGLLEQAKDQATSNNIYLCDCEMLSRLVCNIIKNIDKHVFSISNVVVRARMLREHEQLMFNISRCRSLYLSRHFSSLLRFQLCIGFVFVFVLFLFISSCLIVNRFILGRCSCTL